MEENNHCQAWRIPFGLRWMFVLIFVSALGFSGWRWWVVQQEVKWIQREIQQNEKMSPLEKDFYCSLLGQQEQAMLQLKMTGIPEKTSYHNTWFDPFRSEKRESEVSEFFQFFCVSSFPRLLWNQTFDSAKGKRRLLIFGKSKTSSRVQPLIVLTDGNLRVLDWQNSVQEFQSPNFELVIGQTPPELHISYLKSSTFESDLSEVKTYHLNNNQITLQSTGKFERGSPF